MSSRWIILVPNVLSAMRLGLAASFWAWPAEWRVWIVLVAGLSDFADGYIARRFNASSWAGGLLDAIADKGFTLAALLTLAWANPRRDWPMLLVLSRDAVVIGVAVYAATRREWSSFRKMPSRPLGKWTTTFIFTSFVLHYLLGSNGGYKHGEQLQWWAGLTMLLAILLSVLAAADYFALFWREHRQWLAEKHAPMGHR